MITKEYATRYTSDKANHVYPVEFVVRAFLGTYPEIKMDRQGYVGKKVLDLGYGDGRNMPLLRNLGMQIHGVEISDEINAHVHQRLAKLGIAAELKTGSNAHIPYPDAFFQYVLACHSCYYVEPGDSFDTNLAEITRVLEPGGYLVASLAMVGSYILKDAEPLGDGHVRITSDPYGLRNGTVFRVFNSAEEIQKVFGPFYDELAIGFCDDLFWGIHQKVWTLVGRKK